jgi:hypothetical protein
MAIDVLSRLGKSAVTGVLGKNARRIAGNIGSVIRGDVGSGDSSETAPINRSKQSTKMLSFPLDVGADPGIGNHGHYIMFFINERTNAKLTFGGGFAAGANAQDLGLENIATEGVKRKLKGLTKGFDTKAQSFLDKISPNKLGSQLIDGLTDNIAGFGFGSKGRIKTEKKHQIRSQDDQTVAFKTKTTKRLDTAISMYMPPSVKTSYKSKYEDVSVGAFSAGAIEAAQALMEGKGATDPAVKEGLKSAIVGGSDAALKGMAKELGGGIVEQIEMNKGEIVSDRLELAFKGVEKRTFGYDFKMMPRSKAEADEIAEIIYAFKFHMLPELGDGDKSGRKLKVPSTFDIQYMYVNQENNYLHKISTCYLESMDVTYGGSKYTTYDGNADGAPPVETSISLNFREIELITRERVEEGF